jgi:hypothetical protein
MDTTAIYWRTKFGSIVERQGGPDAQGWMQVRRLTDDAIREWNVADMAPMSDAEVLELARAECGMDATESDHNLEVSLERGNVSTYERDIDDADVTDMLGAS